MECERQTLSSTELRALTEGIFHPVTVRDSFATRNCIFSSDSECAPATHPSEASAVCVVVEHPNGDTELVYEYVDSCMRHGQTTIADASVGDTLWIADWEEVFTPIFTPGERDYAVVADREQAREIEPSRDPIDQSILYSMVALMSGIIPAFVLGVTGIVNGEVGLVGAAAAFAAGGWILHKRMIGGELPYEQLQSALVETEVVSDGVDASTDVPRAVARRANVFKSWATVRVVETDTDDGIVLCTHPMLETPLRLSFDPPRKWNPTEYTLVALTERVGVGSVEQLVGEQLEVRRARRDDADCFRDAEENYSLRAVE